jgi:hypothetical protein
MTHYITQTATLAKVSINGMTIGGIVYYPIHDGCLFISQLPSGAGRSRSARPYDNIVKAVQKRFPNAEVERVVA